MQRAVTAEQSSQFQEVQSFTGDDGVGAAVTARPVNGRTYYSFKIFREHDKAGHVSRTGWFSRRHIAAVRALLAQVEDFLEGAEDHQRAQARR